MILPGWFAGFVLLVAACKKEKVQEPVIQAMTKYNVPYGPNLKQQMDVYLPANRSTQSTRSIILIHGGAWIDGDKMDFNPYVSVLQQRLPGYAIFNINYRLAAGNSNVFPTQENDVKSALTFIYQHRVDYNISGNFVYLGASAGAHLALLQGYKYQDPVKPSAIVAFFGPTELKSLYQSDPLASLLLGQLTGTTPAANPSAYDEVSPYYFVGPSSPPTIILQGGRDQLVPASQSENLQTKLNLFGVVNEYVFYPYEAHGWTGTNLHDSFARITAFLLANP